MAANKFVVKSNLWDKFGLWLVIWSLHFKFCRIH